MLGSVFVGGWAPASPRQHVCQPAPQFPDKVIGRNVTLETIALPIDMWDAERKIYVPQGLIVGHALTDEEFGPMTHGAKVLRSDVRSRQRETKAPAAFSADLPPVYLAGTFVDKLFMIDRINASAAPLGSVKLNASWTAELRMLGYAIAPSTMYDVRSEDDELEGFMIAQGNPFVMDPGNHTTQMNFGGVAYMKADGCKNLFPLFPNPYAATGVVVNTIDCHAPSGMCFFSLWKFDGAPSPIAMWPDCLWYCRPDDMRNPTKCVSQGVMRDVDGHKICRDYGLGGGVHGLTVLKTDEDDASSFDLMLVFTKGMEYDTGASWISKLKVSVSADGLGVTIKSMGYWGTSLWNDTVAKPHDVGCDHAFLDDAGHVWVSTFRKENNGLHMLDYDSGQLKYSIHGFSDHRKLQYTYAAGVSGYGTLFQPNSMMALTTSAERMGIPVTGTGSIFLIDTSAIITTQEA
mmetsp:Transcript_52141/g.137097  ORF Transcript_52141/g.137097 Transcript_52141/m.137097 type:complete len:461 (+) Transcript_52141:32-1414(+)